MTKNSRTITAAIAGLGLVAALGVAVPTMAFADTAANATATGDAAPAANGTGAFNRGDTNFDDLAGAMASAKDGEVITIIKPVHISKADLDQAVNPGGPNYVTTKIVFAKGSEGSTVDGLSIKPKLTNAGDPVVTVDAADITLTNVSIAPQGVSAKAGSLLSVSGKATVKGTLNLGGTTAGTDYATGIEVKDGGSITAAGATLMLNAPTGTDATAVHVAKGAAGVDLGELTVGETLAHGVLNDGDAVATGSLKAIGDYKTADFSKTFDKAHPVMSQAQALAFTYRNDHNFKVTSLANGKLSAVVDNTNNPFAGSLLKFVYYQDGKAYDGGEKTVDETNGNDGTITDVTVPSELDLTKDAYVVAYLGNGIPLFKGQVSGAKAENGNGNVTGTTGNVAANGNGQGTVDAGGTLEQTSAESPAIMGALTGLGAMAAGVAYVTVSKRR